MSKKKKSRYVNPYGQLNSDNLIADDSPEIIDLYKGAPSSNPTPVDTGSSRGYDYEESGYDPTDVYAEQLPILNSIRAENQGILPTLGNGIGRALVNVLPTVIGNVASILDFEDYVNQDDEVGNAITRAMEDFKASVNKDYLPIYQRDPGESFNIGDSAWWIENGSSLAESIGAFAITGAGIGAGFNALGKGLQTINGLAQLGEAGKAAATVLSATGLNQAESITTAMQVYDTTYKTAVANGQDDATAKQNAADAASYSININRANIALNLTSAGAFIRSPNLTRQVRHAFTSQGGKEILQEGSQEYLEETLNYVAQKEGERFGDSAAKGKQYKYDFERSVGDALSAEGIEQGILGFIGGAGQTGLTRVVNRMNGRAAQEDTSYQAQQESIARIQGLQNAGVVPDVTNVFNSMERNVTLQNQIDDEIKAGNDGVAKKLQYQLLNTQLLDALDNGTVDQLESVYTNIQNLSSTEAEAKGLDTDVNSPYNYKKKATEAINLIKDVEDGYLNIANKGYVNPDQVLDTYIQNKTLSRLLDEQRKDLNKSQTQALQDKINLDIQADLNSENPPAELTNLESYKKYKVDQDLYDLTKQAAIANNEKYNNLISPDTQTRLKEEAKVKLQEGLAKAEAKVKAEEEKSVKARQKEVKKKVDKINNTTEESPFQEVPLPDEGDVTDIDSLINPPEATYIPEETDVTDIPEEDVKPSNTENSEILEPEITSDEYTGITSEERTTANIVEQEETNEVEKELKSDGLVRPVQDLVATNNKIKFENLTRQREVGNTIISLNVDYIETVLGDVESQTNQQRIFDTYDDDGHLIINENFDSRLQSPNQFTINDVVNIIVPTYQQMVDRGLDNYSESDYNYADTNIDTFPIAFTDNSGNIIGYLPTKNNVSKRVNPEYKEAELLKNRQLRETIYNNRDKQFTVKITRKSPGSLLTNRSNRDLYNALGDGTKLANDVSIAIYKDNRLQTSLGTNFNNSLINKTALESGYIYSILPTAEAGNYIAAPMNVNTIGEEGGQSILKLIQLFKANPIISADKTLINERNELAREIDLSNPQQFNEAISSIIYTSNENDVYMFKMGKAKLSLGVTPDMNFTWDQVMHDKAAQNRIVDILSKRFHAVQLSKFGQKFNYWSVDDNNKLTQQRYNNYFDYLNDRGVVSTNVQGFPTGENNQMYFTGQSVIEFSDPRNINTKSTTQLQDLNKDTSSNIKEGLDSIYNDSDLSSIGTLQQYNEYLNTIFPNSNISEIMYHDSYTKFDLNNFTPNRNMYFSSSKGGHFENAPYRLGALLNVTNPLIVGRKDIELKSDRSLVKDYESQGYDTLISDPEYYKNILIQDKIDPNDHKQALLYPEVLIFDKSQLHVLGDKQDIQEFKNYIKKFSNTEEVVPAEKPKNKLGIKYKPKNRPQIEEDFNFISNIDNLPTLDEQAEELMKKCQG